MTDISIRGFDGSAGGREEVGRNIVNQNTPDFSKMTLDEIQAWEAANNAAPDTGAVPAAAVVTPQAVERPELPTPGGLSLVPPAQEQQAYQPETGPDPEQQLIRAEFSMGEPFVHVLAYFTAGPVEIIATPQEALELYTKLGLALGAAQQAGVIA